MKNFIVYKDIKELDKMALNTNFSFLDIQSNKYDVKKAEKIKKLLEYLPKKDIDILNLYF